jgi:hypothetical protein
MNELVRFPNGIEWKDTAEGGMYVVLAVREPSDWSDNCMVETYTTVQRNLPKDVKRSTTVRMSHHDVAISDAAKDLWEPHDYQSIELQENAAKALRGKGMAAEARWVDHANHWDDFSVSMLATAFLGSTSRSLWHKQSGGYFEATYDNLTYQGTVLYEVFKNAYGVEPVILTFLDT